LIDNRESWARCAVLYFQSSTKGIDKCRFASAHMSVKQENTLLRILRNHSLRGSGEIRDLINYKLHGTNLLFGTICCIGNNHFFQGYTSMLECAAVIVDKLIVIIGIDEVIIVFCEDKGRAHMKFRQLCFVWIFDDENIPIYVIEVSALLVA